MAFTTTRGRVLGAITLGLGFSSALFQNLVILTAFLAAFALTGGEALWIIIVKRRATDWFLFSQKSEDWVKSLSFSRVLYPGETSSENISLWRRVDSGSLNISSDTEFLHISPTEVNGKQKIANLEAQFKSPFSGEYLSRGIFLDVLGPLGLFRRRCTIPVSIKYTVFPRVLQIAIESAKLIGKSGIGETPVDRPGVGTEFYEMRDYSPGDDFRQVNWKASGRLGRLMVNEKMKEVGASYYLILDARAPSFFDRDRLASTFLELGNALAMLRTPFGVLVHDGKKVVAFNQLDLAERSLLVALNSALEFAKIERSSLPEEIASIPSYKMRTKKRALQTTGYGLLSEIEESGRSQMEEWLSGDLYGKMIDIVRKAEVESERPSILYVSGMFHSLEPVVELGSQVGRIYNSEFLVVNPVQPWVPAEDEEAACTALMEHERRLRILASAKIEYVVGEPGEIARKVFSL